MFALRPIHRRAAFTLIELMIVILIMSLIAAVLINATGNTISSAQQTAFSQDLKFYVRAAMRYEAEQGKALPDTETGVVPEGWEPYIDPKHWATQTAIGGGWDVGQSISGGRWAIGVDFSVNGGLGAKDDLYMTEVDRIVDDGDLNTGAFRKATSRGYYYLIR